MLSSTVHSSTVHSSAGDSPPGWFRRLLRAFRPPRRLRFTRQGRWFTAMTFMVGFGAINTGNNLLYLLLGMMLGLIIVSGVASERVLRGIEVERLTRRPVFAGRKVVLDYRVRNGKRLLASFSLVLREVETRKTRAWRRAVGEARTSAIEAEALGEDPGDDRDWGCPQGLAFYVGARQRLSVRGEAIFPRRGLYKYKALELSTRFPFSLFEKSRRLRVPGELLVLPRVLDVPVPSAPGRDPFGEVNQPRAGMGSEFHALRDYTGGEDWRRIHWKATARRGTPIVREHEQELSRTLNVCVFAALSVPTEESRGSKKGRFKKARSKKARSKRGRFWRRRSSKSKAGEGLEAFERAAAAAERAIEVGAALARHYLAAGFNVGLTTVGGALRPAPGSGQLMRILRALARLEVQESDDLLPWAPHDATVPRILVATCEGPKAPEARYAQRFEVGPDGLVEGAR